MSYAVLGHIRNNGAGANELTTPINKVSTAETKKLFFENILVDRKELARLLMVSPSFVSKLKSDEGLPFYKIGRATRYKLSEVMVFLERRARP
jgi:excisionase family DNA binding protein